MRLTLRAAGAMAPKKKEKKEPRERRAPVPALPEDLLQLTLQLRTAEAHVNELKHRTAADTAVVSQQSEAIAENETSMNDMHKYLEYQMLHAARERLTMQQNLREVEKSRAREVAEATSKMEKAAAAATETIGGLRAELAEAREELGGLQEFKAHRAELEKERADLKAALEAEQEARRREVHEAHLQWWTQRQELNKEMLARIAQAKSNFLDITHEMLDSSVHRTLEENASIGEQLSYASTKMASLAKENNRRARHHAAPPPRHPPPISHPPSRRAPRITQQAARGAREASSRAGAPRGALDRAGPTPRGGPTPRRGHHAAARRSRRRARRADRRACRGEGRGEPARVGRIESCRRARRDAAPRG